VSNTTLNIPHYLLDKSHGLYIIGTLPAWLAGQVILHQDNPPSAKPPQPVSLFLRRAENTGCISSHQAPPVFLFAAMGEEADKIGGVFTKMSPEEDSISVKLL
jgi:hypothetical protein